MEQLILEEEVSGERSQRKKKSVVLPGLLPETSRRTKKPLTPEEIEERNRKVAINAPYSIFTVSLQSKMDLNSISRPKFDKSMSYNLINI